MTWRILGAALLLVALPTTAAADVDLAALRQHCTKEAHAKIKLPQRRGVAALDGLVKRRKDYVKECMAREERAPPPPPSHQHRPPKSPSGKGARR